MLREALVVVPKADNESHSLVALRDKTVGALVDAFGGATVIDANGAWRDGSGKLYNEPVWQFVSAYEPSESHDAVLRNIAQQVGQEGKQLAVYVRYAGGNVEILDTATKH